MAPRLERIVSVDWNSSMEFKPRMGMWASFDDWSSHLKGQGQQHSEERGQRRQRRRVRFVNTNNNDIQQDYIHVREYTAMERQACWYDRADYAAMRAVNDATLDKCTRRIPLDETEESYFGLETQTPMEQALCLQRIRNAIGAVLDEQDDQRQWDGGLLDPDVLAARYSSYTWESQERAGGRGQAQRRLVAGVATKVPPCPGRGLF